MSYTLPKVWTNDTANGGKFANINRPTAGARFTQTLPVGDNPLQLYSLNTPNGIKVNIMLLELMSLGIDNANFDAYKIDISEGEQFGTGFTDINPNSKIPALSDNAVNPPIKLFESGAILLYLAEKFAQFIPKDTHQKTECINWLFWQMASAPYVGGGFGHFYAYAPEKQEYPINRFTMETKRQLDLLDKHFTDKAYICAGGYSIADMAIWAWYRQLVLGELYEGSAQFLDADSYTHLVAWAKRIGERDAVMRAVDLQLQPIKNA